MGVSILNTAISGLTAYQSALNTISNNISNANTPGYSVEHVQLSTQKEVHTGEGYLGTGVGVDNVARSYNKFLNNQVLTSNSAYNSSNTYYTMASQIDNMIANKDTGLSTAINNFFSDANTVANNPSAIPPRQTLLSGASALAAQFNSISAAFSDLNTQVNGNLTASVDSLNSYAKTLAELNVQIVSAVNNGSGQTPNGLLDQRDSLLNNISQLANVSIVNQENGATNVFIGQGQALVLGGTYNTLNVQTSLTAGNEKQVMLGGQNISNLITGGQIAGYIQFRSQVLDPAQQQLGLIATSVATEVNNVQTAGFDLSGNQGLPIFNLGTPSAQVQGQYGDQNLQITANFVAPTSALNLAASYQLTVDSPGSFTLTNLTDNSQVTGLDATTLATTAAADGFSISFSGGSLTKGDRFQISPHFNTASTIQVNPAVINANQIAAASTASGVPGDNSNALALANLQTKAVMANGSLTFSQVYSQLVGSVGTNTNAAQLNSTAQNTVLQNATSAQQSISGVNLNEEAANLILYQNAYQAAAKSVTVVQTLFSSILNAVS